MKPLKVNLLSYEWLLEKSWKTPVLLVFGGMWDYNSRFIYDYLGTVAEKYGEKLITGIVDCDYVPDVFSDFEVSEIPTVMIIEDGKEFKRITKVLYANDVDKLLDYFFGALPY